MKIAAFSVAPVFPDRVLGGSQRILSEVCTALGEAGHEVRLLCTSHPGNREGFMMAPRVSVEPSLLLKGSFPAPYEVPPHRLALTADAVREASGWSDRVYLHADAMHLRGAIGDVPVIRTLHDFVYEEALLSAFSLPAELTIVPSEYLANCIRATAGRTGLFSGPIRVIPNGVRVPEYLADPEAPDGVTPRRSDDLVILFPHRPDERKGLTEALEIAALVARLDPKRPVRLLAPRFPSEADLDEQNMTVDAMHRLAAERAPDVSLELHDWLPLENMAAYYAFGDVTLNPGRFVESFGLVPLESIAAGTPAVCARVGALRELESVPGLSLVDYGEKDAAADAIVSAIDKRELTREGRGRIRRTYSVSSMRARYLEAITGPLPGQSAALRPERDPEKLVLAPWCHVSGDRIWNDYSGQWHDWPLLMLGMPEERRWKVYQRSTYLAARAEEDQAISAGVLIPRWQ